MIGLLQSWIAAAERLAQRLPGWAEGLGARAWPIAVLAALIAVALLVAGTRLGRVVPAVGAAALGWLAFGHAAPLAASWGLPPSAPQWGAAVLLGLVAGFIPLVYPLALGAIPGALLGLQLPLAGRAWLGAAAVALVLGGLLALARRIVIAATVAAAGAVLLGASLLALAARFDALTALTRRPVLLTLLLALMAVAGTAFQAGGRPRPAVKPPR